MTDRKPPRLAEDERETPPAQRESVVRKVAGLDEAAARRSLVGSGTTLLWLLEHLAYVETLWIVHRFAGTDDAVPDDTVHPADTVASAVAAYRDTWRRVDAIVAAASLDDPCRNAGDGASVDLRPGGMLGYRSCLTSP